MTNFGVTLLGAILKEGKWYLSFYHSYFFLFCWLCVFGRERKKKNEGSPSSYSVLGFLVLHHRGFLPLFFYWTRVMVDFFCE